MLKQFEKKCFALFRLCQRWRQHARGERVRSRAAKKE